MAQRVILQRISRSLAPEINVKAQQGFTLVELIAVLILVGILGTFAVSSTIPSAFAQLQASRDTLITAFYVAQQKAMIQAEPIELEVTASGVDIRQAGSSLNVGGTRYPLSWLANQSSTPATFRFDRLGKTSAGSITLSQNDASLTLTVSATGYVY